MSTSSKQQEFLQKFLNSRRKASSTNDIGINYETKAETNSTNEKQTKDEDWLTKKALDEIERTANLHRVKRQSSDLSTSEPKTKTNKKFLLNTLNNCLSHNQRESNRHMVKSSNKLKELERYQRLRSSKQKFGERKHAFKKPEKRKGSDSNDDD
ncbi:hypothetical protein PVAND_007629 [Polypedilum vanderplanki]|uniref:Uncharacterized protein n=1 Tax=Polypedilum vanderplanki TaxID=319348 RepID=A0A9J6C758_POLVA|nr:hypothetical protein PVAND_007629 [Polypedilum vanderplanki]